MKVCVAAVLLMYISSMVWGDGVEPWEEVSGLLNNEGHDPLAVLDETKRDLSVQPRAAAPAGRMWSRLRPWANKRSGGPELSVQQPLGTLSAMLKKEAAIRKYQGSQSLLSGIGKRSPSLSVTQNLDSLVDMIRSDRLGAAQSTLNRLGKRSWGQPPRKMKMLMNLQARYGDTPIINGENKRGPTLSFNNDIQTIADYMNDGRMRGSQATLNRLGKRDQDEWGFLDNQPGKRGRDISVDQALRTVSGMIRNEKLNKARNVLVALGKREDMSDNWNRDTMKRGPDISVDQALRTVSGMIRNEKMNKAKNLLVSLGK